MVRPPQPTVCHSRHFFFRTQNCNGWTDAILHQLTSLTSPQKISDWLNILLDQLNSLTAVVLWNQRGLHLLTTPRMGFTLSRTGLLPGQHIHTGSRWSQRHWTKLQRQASCGWALAPYHLGSSPRSSPAPPPAPHTDKHSFLYLHSLLLLILTSFPVF